MERRWPRAAPPKQQQLTEQTSGMETFGSWMKCVHSEAWEQYRKLFGKDARCELDVSKIPTKKNRHK